VTTELEAAADASARIERLLAEVRTSVSPLAGKRVDELIGAVVEVYGHALTRLVELVEPARRAELASDELLGSLLALHGLHPSSLEARVKTALEGLSAQVGRLELIALEGGVARLRAPDAPALPGGREAIERALQEVAPELERVEVEGLREPSRPGALVQIDLVRSRTRAGTG
jgi:hypothetical protein